MLRLFLLAVASSLLVACASPYMSMSKQAYVQVDAMDVVVSVPQTNVDVAVSSSFAGPGLVGALVGIGIDSIRRANARKDAAPVLETLESYNFRDTVTDAFNNVMGQGTTFNVPVALETEVATTAKRVNYSQSQADAIMYADVYYRIESQNLIITAEVEVYPKKAALRAFSKKANAAKPMDDDNVIYKQQFTYTKEAITADTIIAGLDEGARDIAYQIHRDVTTPVE